MEKEELIKKTNFTGPGFTGPGFYFSHDKDGIPSESKYIFSEEESLFYQTELFRDDELFDLRWESLEIISFEFAVEIKKVFTNIEATQFVSPCGDAKWLVFTIKGKPKYNYTIRISYHRTLAPIGGRVSNVELNLRASSQEKRKTSFNSAVKAMIKLIKTGYELAGIAR